MKSRKNWIFLFVALLTLLLWLGAAGFGRSSGISSSAAESRFEYFRGKVAEERKAQAEAVDESFLSQVKAGAAKRLDFGDGVYLDLIKVGEGTNSYYLGRYEVTQEQYRLVMGKNPSHYKKGGWKQHPVEKVSWNDAMEFCEILNAAFGEEMGDYVFTLPTEAQWKKAAYAGQETEFSGGNNLYAVGWYDVNSDGHTHPVGQKQPNDWGFYDMSGNVYEWCLDADGSYRASRGGSWDDLAGFCRVDYDFRRLPYDYSLGFRVAASLP